MTGTTKSQLCRRSQSNALCPDQYFTFLPTDVSTSSTFSWTASTGASPSKPWVFFFVLQRQGSARLLTPTFWPFNLFKFQNHWVDGFQVDRKVLLNLTGRIMFVCLLPPPAWFVLRQAVNRLKRFLVTILIMISKSLAAECSSVKNNSIT